MGDIVQAIVNPISFLTKKATEAGAKEAGVSDEVASVFGSVAGGGAGQAGGAAKTFLVDKPKAEKEAGDRFAAETDAANKKFQRDMDTRKAQEGAEKKAGKDLLAGRSKQEKRRKSGRASTIAGGSNVGAGSVGTGSAGTLGGAGASGRKSLLGL